MRIGFIGAGQNAQTIAQHLIVSGHDVVLSNSGKSNSLSEVVSKLGPRASGGTKDEVLLQCKLVILTVQWVDAPSALKDLIWSGQILIDATNAHIDSPPDISLEGVTRSRAALAAHGKTSSEVIRDLAPGARIVKSISNMPMAWISDFSKSKPRTVLFTSGDDQEAKRVVIDLLNGAGFAAIDLGSLATGGALHEVGAPLSGLDLHFIKRLR